MFDRVPAESGNAGGAKEIKDLTNEFCCFRGDVLMEKNNQEIKAGRCKHKYFSVTFQRASLLKASVSNTLFVIV